MMVLGLSKSGIEIVARIWTPSTVCDTFLPEMFWKIKQFLDLAGVGIPLPQRVTGYAGARP
jgi:hypothetical protein